MTVADKTPTTRTPTIFRNCALRDIHLTVTASMGIRLLPLGNNQAPLAPCLAGHQRNLTAVTREPSPPLRRESESLPFEKIRDQSAVTSVNSPTTANPTDAPASKARPSGKCRWSETCKLCAAAAVHAKNVNITPISMRLFFSYIPQIKYPQSNDGLSSTYVA